MVTVPAPKTYKILSIALNGSNMVRGLSHDTCACTAWASLHRLDLVQLLVLLCGSRSHAWMHSLLRSYASSVLTSVPQPSSPHICGCTAAVLADENMILVHAQLTST